MRVAVGLRLGDAAVPIVPAELADVHDETSCPRLRRIAFGDQAGD